MFCRLFPCRFRLRRHPCQTRIWWGPVLPSAVFAGNNFSTVLSSVREVTRLDTCSTFLYTHRFCSEIRLTSTICCASLSLAPFFPDAPHLIAFLRVHPLCMIDVDKKIFRLLVLSSRPPPLLIHFSRNPQCRFFPNRHACRRSGHLYFAFMGLHCVISDQSTVI